MFDRLGTVASALREAVAWVQQERPQGDAAVRLVVLFTEIERLGIAGRTLTARCVEESKVWQKDGHSSAARWVAAKTGTSVGEAIGLLETARNLDDAPNTREAFCDGRLSEAQAREISAAVASDRRAESMLLEAARSESLKTLREECRRVRAAAIPDASAANEAIRKRRYFRHWTEPDGAIRVDGRFPPEDGGDVIAAVDVRQDRIFAEARREGRRESTEAYAADALVELAREAASDGCRGPRAMVHVLVDHEVLTTGEASVDQRCEIPGVGRIPPASARAIAGDSILKAIVTKGADVHAVAHLGRTIPAYVRTALEIRDPVCVVPRCDRRHGLEIDHFRVAFADGGATRLDNLARLCRWHHHQKTHLGYRLTGGPGCWIWETPDDLEVLPVRRRIASTVTGRAGDRSGAGPSHQRCYRKVT